MRPACAADLAQVGRALVGRIDLASREDLTAGGIRPGGFAILAGESSSATSRPSRPSRTSATPASTVLRPDAGRGLGPDAVRTLAAHLIDAAGTTV